MKATVQILAPSEPVKSKKDGSVMFHKCQCVVLGENVLVGVLSVGNRLAVEAGILVDQPLPDGGKRQVIPPGAYDLEYGLVIGWDDKELKGGLKSIVAAGKGNALLGALNQPQSKLSDPANPVK